MVALCIGGAVWRNLFEYFILSISACLGWSELHFGRLRKGSRSGRRAYIVAAQYVVTASEYFSVHNVGVSLGAVAL